MAVMAWLVTDNPAVANVAWPVAFSVAVPSAVGPSRKVTVPVGLPAPGAAAATVAVKVTDWPNTDRLVLEVTAEVLLAWLTVCVSGADVLPVKLASPP
jgi:hypothetical protein